MSYKYVKELMSSPAIYCESTATIKEAIKLMKEKNIGFIPITKSNILVGVVTDRDILIRGVGIYKSSSKIDNVMTNGDICFVNPETLLEEAAKTMAENKVRRLVVLNDGHICGVITTKNMLKEPSLIHYIKETYLPKETISNYELYTNSNPHDSLKTADYPL